MGRVDPQTSRASAKCQTARCPPRLRARVRPRSPDGLPEPALLEHAAFPARTPRSLGEDHHRDLRSHAVRGHREARHRTRVIASVDRAESRGVQAPAEEGGPRELALRDEAEGRRQRRDQRNHVEAAAALRHLYAGDLRLDRLAGHRLAPDTISSRRSRWISSAPPFDGRDSGMLDPPVNGRQPSRSDRNGVRKWAHRSSLTPRSGGGMMRGHPYLRRSSQPWQA